ncbi:MAG TPA: RNA methyltransferase [Candidatus Nanoarchaeia archaeon]|nr:RNA methyltransferase [Candidatus Nanoarchaeia archaeon]
MSFFIDSFDNPKIKNILKLQKPHERKKQGVVLVEGYKEILAALKSGLTLVEIFYCATYGGENPSFFGVDKDQKLIANVSREVFEKITYREKPDGYLAIFLAKNLLLADIKLSASPLILVLEGAEKPGNFGAILRTADAAGVDAIIVNDPQLDIYHPNAIRASIGAAFNEQIAIATREETIAYLAANNITTYAASKRAPKPYADFDFTGGTAFILGAEHSGLSEEWRESADEYIKIPMTGIVDSLNLSVSAAIFLFEAVRQRKNKQNLL